MNKLTILVVEDDRPVRNLITTTLKAHDYRYIQAENGETAILEATSHNPDVILLDLGLPDMDGVEIIRKIRTWSNVPIIVISARSEDSDKIEALDAGADDYLAKPFLPRELLLRVQAILNRAYPEPDRRVELAASEVDLERAEAIKGGQRISLTARELLLFRKLYENAGRIVTTGILCETICGEFWQGYETTLSTHIRHLREKIEKDPSRPVSLLTVRGLGYRLVLKEEK